MAGILAAIPAANALLNVFSALAIGTGVFFIRRGWRDRHRQAMWTAVALQVVFLCLYLVRMGLSGVTYYQGPPLFRAVYLLILGSHMLLAMVSAPLVAVTVWQGWRGRLALHRRVGRWTYPVWLYVTVTGPVVYLLLRDSL